MKNTLQTRQERLMPNGKPRYVRCYDCGDESFDRYTVVFTGRYRQKTGGEFWHVGMSRDPFSPSGFGQHGTSKQQIDRPTYGHLGKRIYFTELPVNCRLLVLQDYRYLWDLNQNETT